MPWRQVPDLSLCFAFFFSLLSIWRFAVTSLLFFLQFKNLSHSHCKHIICFWGETAVATLYYFQGKRKSSDLCSLSKDHSLMNCSDNCAKATLLYFSFLLPLTLEYVWNGSYFYGRVMLYSYLIFHNSITL